jgi:hypothetical protein
MSIEPDKHQAGEYNAVAPITKAQAAAVAVDSQAHRIHVDRLDTADDRFWKTLNETLFAKRPDIYLSVGGSVTPRIDFSFARFLSHVRHFGMHGARTVKNVERLADIPRLESLYLNALSLTTFDFLAHLPPGLVDLTLGQTRSKKLSLAPLGRFQKLRKLYVEGHRRDLEVVGELSALEELTLRSITVEDLSWLRTLKKLWSLDIKLGGSSDLSSLAGMRGIKYLELWQILGLESIEVIAELPGLQNVFLQSLKRITTLEPLTHPPKLRRIHLEHLLSVKSLEPLRHCPSLEEFHLVDEKKQWQPEDLIPVLTNPSLRAADVRMWPTKKSARFEELLDEHGKQHLKFAPFVYE